MSDPLAMDPLRQNLYDDLTRAGLGGRAAVVAVDFLTMTARRYGAQERARWLEWLADVGYGIDFTHHPHPPCTPREVAEVYADREPIDNLDLNAGETSTEVHEWVIAQNTGWEEK